MKIISDISLKNFEFWSGGKDTAEDLTDDQFERIERELESEYPDGMTDTNLNDLFWFDREYIYKVAGVYPKFFKLTSDCGEVKFVRASDGEDVDEIDSCYAQHEEIDETEAGTADIEDVGDFDLDDFANSKYFKVTSYIHRNVKIIRCTNDEEVNDMKEAFKKCEIEKFQKFLLKMWRVPRIGLITMVMTTASIVLCMMRIQHSTSVTFRHTPYARLRTMTSLASMMRKSVRFVSLCNVWMKVVLMDIRLIGRIWTILSSPNAQNGVFLAIAL